MAAAPFLGVLMLDTRWQAAASRIHHWLQQHLMT